MADLIVVAVVLIVLGLVTLYIVRAKKRGQKCIGCPDGRKCSGCCSSCKGCSGGNT